MRTVTRRSTDRRTSVHRLRQDMLRESTQLEMKYDVKDHKCYSMFDLNSRPD